MVTEPSQEQDKQGQDRSSSLHTLQPFPAPLPVLGEDWGPFRGAIARTHCSIHPSLQTQVDKNRVQVIFAVPCLQK